MDRFEELIEAPGALIVKKFSWLLQARGRCEMPIDNMATRRPVWIRKVRITNFGPFGRFNLAFSSGVNLISGANASGKTQLLGAIALGLHGRKAPVTMLAESPEPASVTLQLTDGERVEHLGSRLTARPSSPDVRQWTRPNVGRAGLAQFVSQPLSMFLVTPMRNESTEAIWFERARARLDISEGDALPGSRTALVHVVAELLRIRSVYSGPVSIDDFFTSLTPEMFAMAWDAILPVNEDCQLLLTTARNELVVGANVITLPETGVTHRSSPVSYAYSRLRDWPREKQREPDKRAKHPKSPRVFISYSHTPEEQRKAVRELALQLRSDGIDCMLDQFFLSPVDGWSSWAEQQINEAEHVLVVCTGAYRSHYDSRVDRAPGLGVGWEARLIRRMVYERGNANGRFIPVTLAGSTSDDIPLSLRDFTTYHLPEKYEQLFAYLCGHLDPKPELGPLRPIQVLYEGARGASPPSPLHGDDETKQLATELAQLEAKKEEALIAGMDATAIVERILSLRRRIREGGRLQPGDLLLDGRYLLIELAGKGGFARVWRAFDRQLQQTVAIKVLHSELHEERSRRDRFLRGARRMSQLNHPNVVRVLLDPVSEGGFLFFAMEYMAGGDLRRAVQERGPGHLDTLIAVLPGLQLAHERGLIHRDVKPANILLDEHRNPKLSDFDLVWAADTTGGTRNPLGQMIYTAPEIFSDAEKITPAADVYGLAMTALFCITGREPTLLAFRNPVQFIRPLSIDPRLEAVLLRALDENPTARYANAGEFRAALEEVTRGSPLAPSSQPLSTSSANVAEVLLERSLIDRFADLHATEIPTSATKSLVPNQYVWLKDVNEQSHVNLVRFTGQSTFARVKKLKEGVWGIAPRNLEQRLALDAMLHDEIQLVTILGRAGTGKTLLALACGLCKAVEEGVVERVVVIPSASRGKEGPKPGTIPIWARSLEDQLDVLLGFSREEKRKGRGVWELLELGYLEFLPLDQVKGRTFQNRFLVVDGVEELQAADIENIVTTLGGNSRLILLARPPRGKDSPDGVEYLRRKIARSPLAATIHLQSVVSSDLAAAILHD